MAQENENPSKGSAGKPTKADEAASSSTRHPHDVIPADPAPAYEEHEGIASSPPTRSIPSSSSSLPSKTAVPTVNSPFNFPTVTDAPPVYSNAASSSKSNSQPIAFPQVRADADSPFLAAYAPALLSYGITDETWRSFLDTISAFLSAKVSDRAISHAADMAQHLGEAPKKFGKNIAAQAKSIGKDVMNNAKRGNVIGAAMSVISGAIVLPVSTALGAADAVLSLPGEVIGAVTKKPKTPWERATAYAAVANKEWLNVRGLNAQLVDSALLAQLVGLSVNGLLEKARAAKESDAAGQLRALEPHIASLELQGGSFLQLSTSTLWLVLIPQAPK